MNFYSRTRGVTMDHAHQWDFNEKYFDCIYLAIENAEQYLKDSRYLVKKKSYGHATSLAILGQEECAKSLRYFIALMESEEVPKWDVFHKNHALKQSFSMVFRFAFKSPILSYIEESLEVYIKRQLKENKKEIKRRFKEIERKIRKMKKDDFTPKVLEEFLLFINEVFDIPRFMTEFEEEINKDPIRLAELKEYAESMMDDIDLIYAKKKFDEIKQRGFYTWCHKDGFSTPNKYVKHDAEEQINNLEEVLDIIIDAFGYSDPNKMKYEEKVSTTKVLHHFYIKFQTGNEH
jgi:AbiV family abortive infection protein